MITRSLISLTVAAVASILTLAAPAAGQQPAAGQPQPAGAPTEFPIGWVGLAEDPRFDSERAYYFVPVRPLGVSVGGATMGIIDATQIGQVIGVNFSLRQATGESGAALESVVEDWVAEGVHFVIADLPAADFLTLADAVADQDVTLFNVSAQEDRLRGADCRANVLHTIPSYRMYTDATVQFLILHRWRNILVLQGPSETDAAVVEALRASVNQFGARITEVKPFILSADPRNREQNNVALLTAGENYDVLYVADSDGDFARYVQYETNDPRLVVGSAGLTSQAWHWSWERQGAPQANDRFEDINGRRMDSYDWAAYVAVRAVVQSVLRSQSTEYDAVRAYMLSDRMNLDGYKGNPMSFRPWDHQLRQGILLATQNAVMQLAPVDGFLHQTNDLDTLGVDAPQTRCQF